MSLIEMNHITYTWLYPQTCPTQMSRQHSNEYICRNVIGGYHTCEIIRTCEITSTFETTKFAKVTLVSASCNQCVMHTKADFLLAWPTCMSSWCNSFAGHEKPSNSSNANRESMVAWIKDICQEMKYIKYCITLDKILISKALLAVDVAAERVLWTSLASCF